MPSSAVKRLLQVFPTAVAEGNGAVFVGAGTSIQAGYPSWAKLLRDIGEDLGVNSSDIYDLAALAQWSIQETGGATRVREVIKAEIGPDYPVPEALNIIARLPVGNIWTTNYDRLIERAFEGIDRPIDPISGARTLQLKPTPGAARLYKMHGSIERPDDIVISTEDYELFRSTRGPYLPLLQAHLTSMSMLFIGLSFTDPNVRHVLSLVRESFTDSPPEHFAIVRPPQPDDFEADTEYKVRLAQHNLWARDLKRYGLIAVDVGSYDEIPGLLRQVERRVVAQRVWVSGSWPVEERGADIARLYALAESVGRWIGLSGRSLVSGLGLLVGSAATAGFLEAMRSGGGWDLNRRLIVRPFPQPLSGGEPDQTQWTALREELGRQAGIVIFLGGSKREDGTLTTSKGVIDEFEIAKATGAFLLPVGSTGGAALEIANSLKGSAFPDSGADAVRPTDEELDLLGNPATDQTAVVSLISKIAERVSKAS